MSPREWASARASPEAPPPWTPCVPMSAAAPPTGSWTSPPDPGGPLPSAASARLQHPCVGCPYADAAPIDTHAGEDDDDDDDEDAECECGARAEDEPRCRTFCCHCSACEAQAGCRQLWRCRWRRRRRRWRRPPEGSGPEALPCSASVSGDRGAGAWSLWSLWCVLVLWSHRVLGAVSRRAPRPAPCPARPGLTGPPSSFWIVLLLLLRVGGGLAGSVVSPQTDGPSVQGEDVVCQSVDIRNSVENFNRLENCTVVEGFVHITLIDNAVAENFTNITFPKLREIHGYLFLYRVSGLRSLSTLFPNLAVIRGHELMMNYALVIYEMQNLNDIGLISLMTIKRGSIRIEKNPVLCYVDTIDWSYISSADTSEHYIKNNKHSNECPRKCPDKCPASPATAIKIAGQKPTSNLCWTDTHCQKVCSPKCEKNGCLPNGVCCHRQCLGGCTGDRNNNCIACQKVYYSGSCIASCPPNQFQFLERRCVLAHECHQMVKPKGYEGEHNYPWRPFNDSCVLECPPGYSEKRIPSSVEGLNETFSCEKCNGTCEKECRADHVDNIAASQRLRGCTVIKNSLEIQIHKGKNLVKELEENLKSIREIRGYLKITRSVPLVSLNFLKNLEIIHGEDLTGDKYALLVHDNQNLQKLWDWSSNSTFKILRGRLSFHYNPKLCIQEIEALRNKTGLEEFNDHEVSSNGDKVACDMDVLNVTVSKITAFAVLIEWNAWTAVPDPRALLGYVVYRIEAPTRNVTLYESRDACGGDGWSVDDVSVPDNYTMNDKPNVTHIVTNLSPYTQYASYVRTYTIARGSSSIKGAQSKIIYFRTLPNVPTTPKDLSAASNSSSEIVVSWKPSYPPNGNVTKYIVQGVMEEDKPDRSNYCDDPLTERTTDRTEISSIPILPTKPPPGEEKQGESESCSCKDNSESGKRDKEIDSENAANFEDQVHNMIYIRRAGQREQSGRNSEKRKKRTLNRQITDEAYLRYKRSIGDSVPEKFPSDTVPQISANSQNVQDNCSVDVCYTLNREVYGGATTFVLKRLHHFARYSIKVIACRELDPSEEPGKTQNCSPAAIIQHRTLPEPTRDTIPDVVLKENNGTRFFEWRPPLDPNGMIVKYDIQIQPENVETGAHRLHCLSRGNTSFTLPNLPPGNYSFQVRATSINGPGNYTKKQFFFVEEPSTTSTQTVFYVVLGVLCFCLVGGVVVYYARKIWCPSQVPRKLIPNINPDYHSATYIPDEWEVPREHIQILKELGQGSFGMVYEGIIQSCPRTGNRQDSCAIKTVNENSNDRERIEFLNEASVMKGFKTYHVVRLLGVVSQGQPTLVVMELMAQGDLKSYLRKHRPDETDDPEVQPPTLKRILRWAMEIADGMAYLSAKKFVHRDLAARNCMVADDMTVKIGDFGMTRDIYETEYYRKGSRGLMPVRWMAPESLKDGVFTSASDVWSYGVVLWEMATLASQPYQGLGNEEVLRYVKEGGVMEAPENCPTQLYDLMRKCWQFRQLNRPSFFNLVEMLLPYAETVPSFSARSFYHSQEAMEMRHPPEPGRAPLEEAETDMDIEAISPTTPLRCAESEEQPEPSVMPAPAPSSYAQYHKAYSSDSSRDSKASNGSSANVNTANGYIHDWHRHGNGATTHTAHPPHGSHHGPPPTLKTTEC
ncbi:insulin-like receptor isoform X2 [Frankliniella occidentalis]|uniref:Tyrosine-protein kinase receptor n=1 Tax=Frankliniella occidentalis TaxID=133901 RepID=A0A6J1S9G5_FRAOC|nr:insulin-like receptor isoform X2 [Frankliniella occidentalis]